MELWEYIDILRKPTRSWFHPRNILDEKLNALDIISREGYSSLICYLTPFLKDEDSQIQFATCDAIISLLKKTGSKNGYYETSKDCIISKGDIDLYERTFAVSQFVELLTLCSMNGNGHVREKAVKKLSRAGDARAIQFLVYRLADWVPVVRDAAKQGLENYKSESFVDAWIEQLPAFEWLQKVERTNLGELYEDVIAFLVKANRQYVLEHFKRYPDKLRILLARHISNSIEGDRREIEVLVTDRHCLVRMWSLKHFSQLSAVEIDKLLGDKSSRVRLQALRLLYERDSRKDILFEFIADNSATIRQFARFSLKDMVPDFEASYSRKLLEGRQVKGSLAGLAELNARRYAPIARVFLDDDKVDIKKAAFLALQKLNEQCAYEFALAHLGTEIAGISNVVIDFLATRAKDDVLDKARYYFQNGSYEIKKSMLKLFSRVGGWAAIADIIIGTIDNNEELRLLSHNYLAKWRTTAVRLFTSPSPKERLRAEQVFRLAYEVHEDNKYFTKNPLEELDFYFR